MPDTWAALSLDSAVSWAGTYLSNKYEERTPDGARIHTWDELLAEGTQAVSEEDAFNKAGVEALLAFANINGAVARFQK